jgi:N6-L-threonylcarbamoyladenine synthase
LESIPAVVQEAMRQARTLPKDLDALAVTQGPGLIGSLLVGVSFGRALAQAWGLPVIGIDHLRAHLYAACLSCELKFPFVGLVVSGGHTSLYRVKGLGDEVMAGSTRDDAAGEAFDKTAKILGLGYPGGPAIERAALKGSDEAFDFCCACGPGFDFSFSGIKTAVLYKFQKIEKLEHRVSGQTIADLAASFQAAVVEDLVEKSCRLAELSHSKILAVGGGVAFNERLRFRLEEETCARGITLCLAPKPYCLDNAAMVASLGGRLMQANKGKRQFHMNTF